MANNCLLVVADEQDQVGVEFTRFARAEGVECERLDLAGAAARVTIRRGMDRVEEIQPDVSWFLRGGGFECTLGDDDQRFHDFERLSAVWSAAALTKRPVVNRPAAWGFWGRLSGSASVTEQRCVGKTRTVEIFSTGFDLPAGCFHQDVATGLTVDAPVPGTLLRSRRLPECAGWDRVVVVRERAFRVTEADIGPHALEANSIEVVRRLSLAFATVHWAIPRDGSAPVVARVSAVPTAYEVAPVWYETRAALLALLSGEGES